MPGFLFDEELILLSLALGHIIEVETWRAIAARDAGLGGRPGGRFGGRLGLGSGGRPSGRYPGVSTGAFVRVLPLKLHTLAGGKGRIGADLLSAV